MRISLDIEETLADVRSLIIPRLKEEIGAEIEIKDWNLRNSPFSLDTLLELTREIWRSRWREIPLLERDLPSVLFRIDQMNEMAIDIVTARENCKTQMKKWLEMKEIPYKKYISATDKSELDHDVFIDDNPELAGEVNLILYDQPWNREVNDEKIIARIGEERSFKDIPGILQEVRNE